MPYLARQVLTNMGGNSRPQARRFFLYLALVALASLFFIVHWFGAESSSLQQGIGYGYGYTPGSRASLAFTVQPSTTLGGAPISPVQVRVQDPLSNPVTTATDSVTIEIETNPAGGTLSGTLTVAAVNGVATFANLSIDKPGVGYILNARALALFGANSSAFNVTPGPPAKLAFTGQPSNTLANSSGATISPPVQVEVQDVSGQLVTTASNSVTIAIGTNPAGGTLAGTLTVAAVGGVATFANPSINNPGSGYTLVASATGLTGATSGTFNITVGIGFHPATVALTTIGALDTITVKTSGVPSGADGVQLNILHSADVAITSPACVGTFQGAVVLGPTVVTGRTLVGCSLSTGLVSGIVGDVMTFVVTRVGSGNPVLTFGLAGTTGTQFSDRGRAISAGTTNTLQITGASSITGIVRLDRRSPTFPTNVGHSIAKVTLSPGGLTASVSAAGSFTLQGVLAGTYTLTASAPGYVSRERTNVVVAGSRLVSVPTEALLRCGLVNNDNVVNIDDLTAMKLSFGSTVTGRVDASGRFVDQNGDGTVNIDDITCVVSRFGTFSPRTWP
jgi:uncharacterized MnhB-related membrane protein